MRPESVTVQLMVGTEVIDSAVLDAEHDWQTQTSIRKKFHMMTQIFINS